MGGKRTGKDYFVRSALKEVSLLRKHFGIAGLGDDVTIPHEVSPASIRAFFREYLASVRPPNLGDSKILPRPDKSRLRGWYVGDPDVNLLLNLVVRHCLYVDQIAIVDPFIVLPHDEVVERPQVWTEVVVNRALCLCALEDWIEEEILLLVPSLLHYHPEIQQLIFENPHLFLPHHTPAQWEEEERHAIVHLLLSESPEGRDALLDVMESMGRQYAQGERDYLLEEAEQYESKYPIRFRLPSEYYQKHFQAGQRASQVVALSLGVPLLLAPVIAEQIGAFLIFERRVLYDLLSANRKPLSAGADSMEQLAIAFQALDFPFLHNVSLKRALSLRRKGYLHSFRVYLRDLWSTAAQAERDGSLDARILEFTDRLKAEYALLEQEWNSIRRELRLKAVTSGLVSGLSAGSAIVFGNIDWTAGAVAGAAAVLLKEHVAGYVGSSERVQKTYANPLSVFLMLK